MWHLPRCVGVVVLREESLRSLGPKRHGAQVEENGARHLPGGGWRKLGTKVEEKSEGRAKEEEMTKQTLFTRRLS